MPKARPKAAPEEKRGAGATVHPPARARIFCGGVVQGVGFRPFVHQLALGLELAGWVLNSSAGVFIEIEGARHIIELFLKRLLEGPPPMARITSSSIEWIPPVGQAGFHIEESRDEASAITLVSPDIAVCADCERELTDKSDRRHRYPFINCTNCGPRYTIIESLPYDRPKTTMREFAMCADCAREYGEVADRRYHAQPDACDVCGPRVRFEAGRERAERYEAIKRAARLIKGGKIVAVKGLGGFHLASDASDADAVSLLRRRKRRENDKPFAVMVRDEETLYEICYVDKAALALLLSPAHPIVLLPWRRSRLVTSDVAPKNKYLGVMLPYTPLHRLLLDAAAPVLVMTSGNVASEPLVKDNDEAKRALASLADGFLFHDRVILNRIDDTVMKVVDGKPLVIRRARGYVPLPVTLKSETPSPILAVGAHLKNTFAISRGNLAFLGPHIGDMENLETLSFFEEAVSHFKSLFRIEPAVVAHDLHPGYVSTKWALEQQTRNRQIKLVGVQHHAAHVAAAMAEYGLTDPVIGVSFDGLGYGDDGAIWGGEFFAGDLRGLTRVAHLEYVPMPGGDLASMQPWRMAIAFLWKALGQRMFHVPLPFLKHVTQRVLGGVVDMMQANINSPLTSSAGRLFDAVSALAGVCREHTYDAQAAIELEMCADANETHAYQFPVVNRKPLVVKTTPAIRQVVDDILAGRPPSVVSARLHRGIANAIVEVARRMSVKHKTSTVVLGGGVFQNGLLCTLALDGLRSAGLTPYVGSWIPPNDGGLALGQLALASERIRRG